MTKNCNNCRLGHDCVMKKGAMRDGQNPEYIKCGMWWTKDKKPKERGKWHVSGYGDH